MKTGTQVRLKSDVGRRGFVTGRTRERAGRILIQVQFPDSTQYVPVDQLESISHLKENPLDLFEAGKLGRASDLRRTITHARLGGRLVNLIYSMEITNTDFYAYQFKPVLKILNSHCNGILIADEVGLGKTIEAGLIWTELRSRFDFRRLMVVCPAMLREKWRLELSNRFGIKAQIFDATDAYETLKQASIEGDTASFYGISSLQGLRPIKGWEQRNLSHPAAVLSRFLLEQEHEAPLIDLLIIDESHYLRNPESKSANLGRLLRNVSEYTVLLSATPIHLKSNDLYQLLNLLDEDTFNSLSAFENILSANEPVIRAREAVLSQKLSQEQFISLLDSARRHPLLKDNRQLHSLVNSPPSTEKLADLEYRSVTADKLESVNVLGHVITRTRKREVSEWHVIRRPNPERVPLTEPERQFYELVTKTVRDFCSAYSYYEGFLLVTPQRQMASSMPAALREWKRRKAIYFDGIYEDIGREVSDRDLKIGPVTKEIISKVDELSDLTILWHNDSKFKRLLEVLRNRLTENPSEKIVVFSYFRATLEYLQERLQQEGIRSIVMMGGEEYDKNTIVRQFSMPGGPNVLLSSEVGSEGIDLQFARFLINYDLPWNPMKVEQRIGRIDRLGQQAPTVFIWNLFYEDTIDSRIYDRLFKRLKIFERALGGLEPVLGEQIQKLTFELFREQLTPEEEIERIDRRAQALVIRHNQEEKLENEAAHLIAHGDYILNQVKAARELNRWINQKDIQTYVLDFFNLHYSGCVFKQLSNEVNVFEVRLTNEAKHDLERFLKTHQLRTATELTRNDPSPVICRFENKIVPDSLQRGEVINQIHPLVRFVTHSIENQDERPHPAVSVKLKREYAPENFKTGIYVFTIQKWSLQGLRDIEQLYFAAIHIDEPENVLLEAEAEKLVIAASTYGEDWLEASNELKLTALANFANNYSLAFSDKKHQEFAKDMQDKNEDRADIQEKTLDNHLKRQLEKLESVKQTHQSHGRDSLVKATEGRINALKNRVDRKRIEIGSRRKLNIRNEEICVGVILVV